MLSGGTTYELRNFHTPQDVDVRFRLNSCKTPTNWFKSDTDVLSAFQLLNIDDSELSIVTVAGSVGLYREATALKYLSLSTSSLLRTAVVGDDSQVVFDRGMVTNMILVLQTGLAALCHCQTSA